MKNDTYYIIIYITAILLFITICVLCLKPFEGGDESGNEINYETLYFLNDSLVNGASVVEAINYFSGQELMILVKTKKADYPEVYNWDGKRQIEGYYEERNKLESGYINKTALFRVNMEKDNDRIICVSFCQE